MTDDLADDAEYIGPGAAAVYGWQKGHDYYGKPFPNSSTAADAAEHLADRFDAVVRCKTFDFVQSDAIRHHLRELTHFLGGGASGAMSEQFRAIGRTGK